VTKQFGLAHPVLYTAISTVIGTVTFAVCVSLTGDPSAVGLLVRCLVFAALLGPVTYLLTRRQNRRLLGG